MFRRLSMIALVLSLPLSSTSALAQDIFLQSGQSINIGGTQVSCGGGAYPAPYPMPRPFPGRPGPYPGPYPAPYPAPAPYPVPAPQPLAVCTLSSVVGQWTQSWNLNVDGSTRQTFNSIEDAGREAQTLELQRVCVFRKPYCAIENIDGLTRLTIDGQLISGIEELSASQTELQRLRGMRICE